MIITSTFSLQVSAIQKGFLGGSAGKESACNVGDLGSIPGLGRSPGEENSYLLQCSALENPMDCVGYGITKSPTSAFTQLEKYIKPHPNS